MRFGSSKDTVVATKSRWLRRLCFLLVAVGILLSVYLAWRGQQLLAEHPTGFDICSVFQASSCDSVLLSKQSRHFGVPLSIWSFLYFVVLWILLVPRHFGIKGLCLGGIGGGVSLFLITRLLDPATGMCWLCLATHFVNLTLMFLLGIHFLIANKPLWGMKSAAVACSLIPICVLIGFFAERQIWRSNERIDPNLVLARYRLSEAQELQISASDLALGSPAAKIQMVIYGSFECHSCRRFAKELPKLHDRFLNEIYVVFRHLPLGQACNPHIPKDIHPLSCAAAEAAQAAAMQDAFWEYHDRLFAGTTNVREDVLRGVANAVELNIDQWLKERGSHQVQNKIRTDVDSAHQLGIEEVPAVYLNGRRVRPVSVPILTILIEFLKRQST